MSRSGKDYRDREQNEKSKRDKARQGKRKWLLAEEDQRRDIKQPPVYRKAA